MSHLILTALLVATTGSQATVIYADNFSGSGSADLIGASPTTALVADTWTATTNFNANGSFTTGAGSATLSFTPTVGTIYELTATIVSTNTNGDWIGVGFADANATWDGSAPTSVNANRFTGTVIRGTSWVFSAPVANPATFLFQGVGSSGGTAVNGLAPSTALDDSDGTVNVRIVLDTTATNWTTTFFLNNVLYASHAYAGAAPIDSVGFSTTGVATGTISNFKLEAVPEPGFTLLGGLGLLGLLGRRRRI